MHNGSKAFSLLEIIIAITIIALFITLPILAYSNYSRNSRDNKRKNDILKISQALEQYKAEKGTYPINLDELVADGYLTELPVDPKDGQDIDGEEGGPSYGYAYESDGTTYELLAHLENETVGEGGASGTGVFVVNPVNPGGTEAPVAQLTQKAVNNPSPTVPTSTPYQSPTRLPSISYTPSPTNTPTNTPTPSNTPTNTPTPTNTLTPSPTPRYCWATGGVCNPNCQNIGVTGITTHQVYTQCVAASYQACWTHAGVNCADTAQGYDYQGPYNAYRSTPSCTGSNPVSYLPMGSNDCTNNGTGTCYRFYNGNFNGYTFQTSGTGSVQSVPSGSCSPYQYMSGGGAPGWNGQVGQCSWGANSACPVATWQPGGAQVTKYKWTGGFCSSNGTGTCYLINGTATNYPESGGPAGCNTGPYWDSYTQCQWIQY